MNTNILDVKVDDHGECGFCKKQRGELVIPWETYAEWLLLMQKMGNQEFGAVFDVVNGIVGNVRYPEQEISSASVTFTEELGGNGVMHSHHSMGSFHSHQDDTQFRNLAEYSVVLSHSGALGTKRVTLPCGGFGHVPLDIKLEGKEPARCGAAGFPSGMRSRFCREVSDTACAACRCTARPWSTRKPASALP